MTDFSYNSNDEDSVSYGDDSEDSIWYGEDEKYSDVHKIPNFSFIMYQDCFSIETQNYEIQNNDKIIPFDIICEIIWFSINMIPRSKRIKWWKDLHLVSKNFTKYINQINNKIISLFGLDKLLLENLESNYRLFKFEEFHYILENYSIDINELWFPDGNWKKLIYIKNKNIKQNILESKNYFPNKYDLEIGLKYKQFSDDIDQYLIQSYSNIFKSHTNYKNFKFMIKKSDILIENYQLKEFNIKQSDSKYNDLFWNNFIFQDNEIKNMKTFCNEFKDNKNYDNLVKIEKCFEKHFPINQFVYVMEDTSSEYWGLYVFIGEMENYYIGFWFLAERNS